MSFGFFAYSALRQRVEPNWPAPAFVPAIVLLASGVRTRPRRWLRAGVVLAAVMSLVIYAQGVAPILPLRREDPIARAFGWRDWPRRRQPSRAVHASTTATTWLGGDRYQEAAELALAFSRNPRFATFAMNLSGRPNQYDLWPRFPDVAKRGDDLVIVLDDSDVGNPHEAIKALSPYFAEARRGPLAPLRRGSGEIGARRVWTLVGWHGGWPAPR